MRAKSSPFCRDMIAGAIIGGVCAVWCEINVFVTVLRGIVNVTKTGIFIERVDYHFIVFDMLLMCFGVILHKLSLYFLEKGEPNDTDREGES